MVVEVLVIDLNEVRILLTDGSFVDVWYSLKLHDRYSYHWERRAIDGTIFRHDNAPHRKWESLRTFPHHFHDGSEDNVVESELGTDPAEALRNFLGFIRSKLRLAH